MKVQKSAIIFCRLKKKCYICSALVHPERKRGTAQKVSINNLIKAVKSGAEL